VDIKIFEAKSAEKNKSQKEIALEIGMRPSRLSDMKAGRLKGYKYQRRISEYLGVPQKELFPEDGDHHNSCQS